MSAVAEPVISNDKPTPVTFPSNPNATFEPTPVLSGIGFK